MNHIDLYELRETYNRENILLCFNGPFSQGLIEEIGLALRRHLQSESVTSSASIDVFAVYIELAQNIREYSLTQNYNDVQSSATIIVGRNKEGRYEVAAGNIVEPEDAGKLFERVQELASLDKAQLKAVYKEQLRKPREGNEGGAGLGLIDLARKASVPISCGIQPIENEQKAFFSIRVVI